MLPPYGNHESIMKTKKQCVIVRLIMVLAIFIVISMSYSISSAAQSIDDIPISSEKKEAILKEMLGSKIEKIQRDEEYVIGHGDIISVTLYEEGDMAVVPLPTQLTGPGGLSGVQVMMDGRVSLKDIGDVEVVGLTLEELADYLKKIYLNIYENPVVITTLIQSNSLRYTVTGEVVKPGVYKLEHPMNLVQVIAQAGGFAEWADKEITVVRKELRKEDVERFKSNTLKFDYDEFVIGKELEKNISVRSGDIIIVK